MTRDEMLAEIVERELIMFQAAPSEGGPASCQQRPDVFRMMRQMAHCVHEDAFLVSYLADLRQAEQAGRNFMIEKYARMDELIPPLSDSPLLDKIVDAECAFLEQAVREAPDLIKIRNSGAFPVYLRCELETLSENSRQLYWDEIVRARKEGRNPLLDRHLWLARKMGRQTK